MNKPLFCVSLLWTDERVVTRVAFIEAGADFLFVWGNTDPSFRLVNQMIGLLYELSEGLATDGFSQVWSQLVELQNDAIVVPATFRSQFNAPASEVDNVLLEAVKLGLLVPVYRLKAEDDVLEELGQSDWTSNLAMLARVFDTTERGLVVDGTKPENIRVAFRRVRARGPA